MKSIINQTEVLTQKAALILPCTKWKKSLQKMVLRRKSYISEIKISAAVLPAVPVPSSENVLFPIW